MTKAIFPGSFDPIHNGHMKLIKVASLMYESLVVYVANNTAKKYSVSLENRFKIVKKAVEAANLLNVTVVQQGQHETTPAYTKKNGITNVIRGLREEAKLSSYESNLAEWYLEEDPKLEFHYIVVDEILSGTIVRSNLLSGKPIDNLVPVAILSDITKHYGD